MNRLYFLLSFLFFNYSYSQISKSDFDKVVDYVNCRYTLDYLESKKSEIKNKSFLIDLDKYKNSFSIHVKSYKDINKEWNSSVKKSTPINEAILGLSKEYPKANALWNYIENKKNEFNPNWSKEELIESVIILSDNKIKLNNVTINFKTYLNNTTLKIKNELDSSLSDSYHNKIIDTNSKSMINNSSINTQVENSLQTPKIKQGKRNSSENDRSRNRNNDDNSNYSIKKLFLFLILILVAVFVYINREFVKQKYLFLTKKNSINTDNLIDFKQRYKELELENFRLKDFETENAKLRDELKSLKSQLREIELKRNPIDKVQESHIKPSEIIQNEKRINCLYADAIIDGFFYNIKDVADADTIYILNLTSQNQAHFSVFKESVNRIIKNPDFINECIKQRTNDDPTTIQVEPGEAQKDDFGKWRITKKAIVKFI